MFGASIHTVLSRLAFLLITLAESASQSRLVTPQQIHSLHERVQCKGHTTSDEEENKDNELLSDSNTQLDRCLTIDNTESAHIFEVYEKTVGKAIGK